MHWNHMPNDAIAYNHLMQSMLEASKHNASEGIYTIAMQDKAHMTKTAQNSPKTA